MLEGLRGSTQLNGAAHTNPRLADSKRGKLVARLSVNRGALWS